MSYFSRAATKLKHYFTLLWYHIRHPKESKKYDMKGMEQTHTCANCGLEYKGLFCPRCGQKSTTKRLTPKNLLSNTLEVWGFNNRSFPGTILELFYRPGHFIRDYLKGHRAPYYDPIKLLFFLCIILAIEISVGLIKPVKLSDKLSVNSTEKPKTAEEIKARTDSLAWAWADDDDDEEDLDEEDVELDMTLSVNGDTVKLFDTPSINDSLNIEKAETLKTQNFRIQNAVVQFILAVKGFIKFRENSKALYTILLNITLALICWWVFRKEKVMGHLSYTEHFFIQIYISCQMLVLSILILPFLKAGASLPVYVLPAIMVWDFKQLYQISWAKSLLKTILVLALNAILVGIAILLGIVLSILFIALINGIL